WRYRIGQLAMLGCLIRIVFSPGDMVRDACNNFVDSDDVEPNGTSDFMNDDHVYAAALAVLRANFPEYLAYGRALRDPVVSFSSNFVNLGFNYTDPCSHVVTHPAGTVPPVLTSAWSDNRSGHTPSVGIVATNFSTQDALVSLGFTPVQYFLDG